MGGGRWEMGVLKGKGRRVLEQKWGFEK